MGDPGSDAFWRRLGLCNWEHLGDYFSCMPGKVSKKVKFKLLVNKRKETAEQNEMTTYGLGENICKHATDKGLMSKIC